MTASMIMEPQVPTRKVRFKPNFRETNTPPMEIATRGAISMLENTPCSLESSSMLAKR